MGTMRICVLVSVLMGCGGMSRGHIDAGGDTPDMIEAPTIGDMADAPSPTGFGAACQSSIDCRGYAVDAGPGFLGCASYLGASYCTMPCAPSPDGVDHCWSGSTCKCVSRANVSGFDETDCYCAK